MMACGALGHTDDLTAVARAGLDRATNSYESAHFRFWAGGVYARACRLTGRIAECLTAAELLSELAKDAPGLAYANLIFLLGIAQLMRGDLHAAGTMLQGSARWCRKPRNYNGFAACVYVRAGRAATPSWAMPRRPP